jgi:hypothetical protein
MARSFSRFPQTLQSRAKLEIFFQHAGVRLAAMLVGTVVINNAGRLRLALLPVSATNV